MPRSQSRPKTNHTCHQNPNPSRETVPLRQVWQHHRVFSKTARYLDILLGVTDPEKSKDIDVPWGLLSTYLIMCLQRICE
jgi:hypothetical protein